MALTISSKESEQTKNACTSRTNNITYLTAIQKTQLNSWRKETYHQEKQQWEKKANKIQKGTKVNNKIIFKNRSQNQWTKIDLK